MKSIFKQAILLLGLAFFCACSGGLSSWDGPKKIGIQPFGEIADQQVDSVKIALEKMYGLEVCILDRQPLPDMAYTEIRYPRYRADSLVEWISQHQVDSVDLIVGLTNKDISITKYKNRDKGIIKEPTWQYRDFGIFGLGRVGGNSCVVSSHRLWHNGASEKIFYKRLCRISCHEVGHVLGLHHCPEPNCLMNDANERISTIDNSTGTLCNKCWNKIN